MIAGLDFNYTYMLKHNSTVKLILMFTGKKLYAASLMPE